MTKVDFSYHRPGWTSCKRTQEYLAKTEIETKKEQNAKKETLQFADAKKLLKTVNTLFAAKGKKIVKIDMKKEKPDDETLQKLIIGPTGNLRAPTLIKGKSMIVGFNAEMFDEALK